MRTVPGSESKVNLPSNALPVVDDMNRQAGRARGGIRLTAAVELL
jgi:hypothetical protein